MSTMVNTCAFLPGQTAFAARRLRASMPATVWVAGNPGLRRRAAAVELFTTLPDFHFTLEGAWGEGDRIAWRGTMRGTMTGPLGEVPATGRSMTGPIGAFFQMADGKNQEAWIFVESPGVMQQLGLVPRPGAP